MRKLLMPCRCYALSDRDACKALCAGSARGCSAPALCSHASKSCRAVEVYGQVRPRICYKVSALGHAPCATFVKPWKLRLWPSLLTPHVTKCMRAGARKAAEACQCKYTWRKASQRRCLLVWHAATVRCTLQASSPSACASPHPNRRRTHIKAAPQEK